MNFYLEYITSNLLSLLFIVIVLASIPCLKSRNLCLLKNQFPFTSVIFYPIELLISLFSFSLVLKIDYA